MHDEETIGDEGAESEGDDDAVRWRLIGKSTLQVVILELSHLVEHVEELADGGRGEFVHAEFLPHMLITHHILGDGHFGTWRRRGGWRRRVLADKRKRQRGEKRQRKRKTGKGAGDHEGDDTRAVWDFQRQEQE